MAATLFASVSRAQEEEHCLTSEQEMRVIATLRSPTTPANAKDIRKELIQMREEHVKLEARITSDLSKSNELLPQSVQMGEKQLMRVCQILRNNGWPAQDALKDDGFNALQAIIVDNQAYRFQRELLPVLIEAAKKDFVQKRLIASLVDSLRIGSGQPQIFGTQAAVRADAVYIYPLLNDDKVDEWRKEYDLPTLASEIRNLEDRYFLPVLKSQRRAGTSTEKPKSNEAKVLGIPDLDNDLVKVTTSLVNLNVRVLSADGSPTSALDLTKNDFSVLENGVEQDIAFFSTTDRPFDLVLLLDFSGSTSDKRSLIKKAAQRFVDSARPNDRIAVVAFATEIKTISDLTTNKTELDQKIKDINMDGSSPIWESLEYTFDKIIDKESKDRRSAVVFMTDGEDNSKDATFADVIEMVRHHETTIFSVWLNTGFGSPNDEWGRKFRLKVRSPMQMMASETGGEIYDVDNFKDLNGVYDRVINDLAKVYTLGYEPKNDTRDAGWRDLTVKIKNRPDLVAKTRSGYYAN